MGFHKKCPSELLTTVGVLNDEDILQLINRDSGYLFQKDTTSKKQIKQATYEIRVGQQYEILKYKTDSVIHEKIDVSGTQEISIDPGQTVRVIAMERFKIPTDIFAKATTIGQLFSAGLSAETTYADPGYEGDFYITLSNISTRTLILKSASPLARVEFHRLQRPVTNPHEGSSSRRVLKIDTHSDLAVRTGLRSKTIAGLIKEVVDLSVDDALHSRSIRSEVILEKYSFYMRTVRWLSYMVSFLFFLVILFALHLFGAFQLTGFWQWAAGIASSAIAAVVGGLCLTRITTGKWRGA